MNAKRDQEIEISALEKQKKYEQEEYSVPLKNDVLTK